MAIKHVVLTLNKYNDIVQKIKPSPSIKVLTKLQVNKNKQKISNIGKKTKKKQPRNNIKTPQSVNYLTKLYQQNPELYTLNTTYAVSKDKEMILDAIPANKILASVLLNWVAKHTKVIGWNEKRNLVLYNQVLPDTDLATIIHNSLKKTERPNSVNGALAFYETLRKLNCPLSLIKNPHAKAILERK